MEAIQSTALSSPTRHTMPSKTDRKWTTECLNTMFHLPTLLCPVHIYCEAKKKKI